MTDANTICHDLDLLDDWLAGKGYGEEAGLVLRALSLIHKLQDGVRSTIQERDVLSGENFDLRAENEKLRAENETHKEIAVRETMNVATLRAALKPFALSEHKIERWFGMDIPDSYNVVSQWVTVGDLRAAAAALKEQSDE